MVLPVLATYGQDLAGATPALIGLAIGAYGPDPGDPADSLRDHFRPHRPAPGDRRRAVICRAPSRPMPTPSGVIAGRVLQGAGAISAAVMALLSDLTREQHRTKAMAMIGMSIGVSFAVAMVLGPVLTHLFGLHGLFWFTAGMALVGLLLILFFVPQPDHMTQHRESSVARQAPAADPEARRPAAPGRRHPDPPRHPHGQLRRLAAGAGARGWPARSSTGGST